MPLDPSILAQGKPFQTPDPLQNYAKVLQIQNAQNQNALTQYQLGATKRGEEGQNALSRAQQAAYDPATGTYDMNKLRGSMISGGFGALLPDAEKKMGELRTQQLAQQKAEGEVVAGRTKQFRDLLTNVNNPSAAAQWLQAQYKDPVLGPVVSSVPLDQALAEIPTDPAKFNEWRNQNALGMEEFIKQNKPTTFETGTGQVKQRMSMPGLGGAATLVPGSTVKQEATPGERMTDARARQQMARSERQFEANQENQNKPVFNAAAGGFISPPTKDNPQGTFTPATDIQTSKDQQAAIKALQSAGYDPVTGEDKISKLISKSTSGGLQAAGAATLSFLGKTTEGRKAISALEGTANQIATDLAGGKLGAGISNTDREFIVGALGDVSNPMKTAEERLAGWTAAKERMMRVGLIPAPKPGAPAAPANKAVPAVNSKGWTLHTDAKGNKAYVSPDGKQFEEVK
jgi:hypothetical protein